MKKILMLVVVLAVVSTTVEAKNHKKNTVTVFDKADISSVQPVKRKISDKNTSAEFIRDKHVKAQAMHPIRMGVKNLPSTSAIDRSSTVQEKLITTSVPDGLIGTFICSGVSYFGGKITGETVIRADNSIVNKIWISNLIPGVSSEEVYGTLSSDQETISIPQGQLIYSDGTNEATLSIYQSSDDITGLYDSSTGVITISTDLWGASSSDGWYEVFTGNVTYTRSDMAPPVASYYSPQGGLFLGLDPDTWNSYYSTCQINAPFVTWNWKNSNIEDGVTYGWSCTNYMDGEDITSDQDSLLMEVETDYYSMPELTATNEKGLTGSYILGADYINKGYDSYSLAGGDAVGLGFDETCDYSCANQDNGFTLLSYDNDSYIFGTGAADFNDSNYESLLVYYDQPLSTLYFEGVNVYLYVFDAPDNTPFTLNVVAADVTEDGYLKKGNVIASSTITANDVVTIKDGSTVYGYTLKFSDFVTTDGNGFEIVKEDFQMDQAFFLELTGFNVDGVSLGVCSEEINPSDGNNRSGFMSKGDESIYYWDSYRQTMYFDLAGMAYSYIWLSQNYLYDSGEGGSYEIEAIPFFDTLYFDQSAVPDWVNVEITNEEYSDSNWVATIKVTLDPLSSNSDIKLCDLVLHTVGATRTLSIQEGGLVSSKEIKKPQSVFAYKNEQGFMVNYPKEMTTMNVYSALGVKIGQYNLNEAGSYQLDGSSLAKGIYLLTLYGNNKTETIRVQK